MKSVPRLLTEAAGRGSGWTISVRDCDTGGCFCYTTISPTLQHDFKPTVRIKAQCEDMFQL